MGVRRSLGSVAGLGSDPAAIVPEWMRYLARRLPDETPHAYDDFFDDGDKSDWTEVDDTGTPTWTESRGIMSFQGTGSTAGDTATLLKSLGSLTAPITIETAVRLGGWGAPSGTMPLFGIVFTSGTTFASSKLVGLTVRNAGAAASAVDSHYFTNWYGALNDFGWDPYGYALAHGKAQNIIYLRTIWTATNTWSQALSFDGVSWNDINSAPWGQSMTPTHFGLLAANYTGTIRSSAAFEYFRVYETDLDV